MNLSQQIAKHLLDVHFGGNWATSSLKEHLSDVTWQEATTPVHSFNTLATLLFHVNYYISAVSKVLEGEPLTASDKFSFDHPPITGPEDWTNMLEKAWADAEKFADLIGKMPDDSWMGPFIDGKYGNNYRNIGGIIEHTHYHLGQIVLIKKWLRAAV